jgi:hypothetical protein
MFLFLEPLRAPMTHPYGYLPSQCRYSAFCSRVFRACHMLVYNWNFKGLGLSKLPNVGLKPNNNLAGWIPLSLVNRLLRAPRL